MVEQELGVRYEVCRLRMHQKGNSEETDTIVARFLPKHRKSLCDRGRHRLSISLLYRTVQIGLGRLLLLCTLTPSYHMHTHRYATSWPLVFSQRLTGDCLAGSHTAPRLLVDVLNPNPLLLSFFPYSIARTISTYTFPDTHLAHVLRANCAPIRDRLTQLLPLS